MGPEFGPDGLSDATVEMMRVLDMTSDAGRRRDSGGVGMQGYRARHCDVLLN